MAGAPGQQGGASVPTRSPPAGDEVTAGGQRAAWTPEREEVRVRAYLGEGATPCSGPSGEHWVPVYRVPTGLSWTDKELMNREGETELEPERRQVNH